MNRERIDELLIRYYDGITTPEEESELKKWFSGGGDFTGFEAEVEIFNHYYNSTPVPEPSPGFEQRLISAVDAVDDADRRGHARKRQIAMLSAAATILILISSWFLLTRHKEPGDTFSDPRLAYAETKKILNEVSIKLNKGTNALREIDKVQKKAQISLESFDRSASIISASLKRSRLFDEKANLERDNNTNNK